MSVLHTWLGKAHRLPRQQVREARPVGGRPRQRRQRAQRPYPHLAHEPRDPPPRGARHALGRQHAGELAGPVLRPVHMDAVDLAREGLVGLGPGAFWRRQGTVAAAPGHAQELTGALAGEPVGQLRGGREPSSGRIRSARKTSGGSRARRRAARSS